MDALVKATGVSRHGIYQAFGGKRALFVACLKAYQGAIVTPAFAAVEKKGAGLDAVAIYFETQIGKAEELGLPGPGCLVANTMTELGAHDAELLGQVEAHNFRLHRGFLNALQTDANPRAGLSNHDMNDLAALLVTAAQGLWSLSRSVTDADHLRRIAATLLDLVKERIGA